MSILNQQLLEGWCFRIYVVDDGSEEAVQVRVDNAEVNPVNIVRLEKNSGCSVARNQGAFAGDGEAILFLDADCSLKDDQVLKLLLNKYIQGSSVCFGQIYVEGDSFWARYQNEVAKERAARFKGGNHSSMSTAIFLVKREVFELVGGFDEVYHFGFEDRDLFLTLIKSGVRVALEEEALVLHNDNLSLLSVTKKLYEAGKTSSVRFIQKHPEEYQRMSYAKADVRYSRGGLIILVFLTKPIFWPLICIVDWGISKGFLPFFVARKLVKLSTGLAYLHGSAVAFEN